MTEQKKKIRMYFCLLLALITAPAIFQRAYGQTTIGSSTLPPANSALLELKTFAPDANNVTTTQGGLLFSRVKLVNKKTLEPFIAVTNDDWKNNSQTKIKLKHAGLVVYNLESSMSSPDENKRFLPGLYTWDGEKWEQIGNDKYQAKWFYPPAFNLPLKKIGANATFDLYKVYENQFNKTNTVNSNDGYKGDKWVTNSGYLGENIPAPTTTQKLYSRTDLDYVVTWYDNKIITNVKINDQGIMTYDVLDNDPDVLSFMNMIFVIKQ